MAKRSGKAIARPLMIALLCVTACQNTSFLVQMPLLKIDVLQMDVADAFVKHPMNAYWKEMAITYINLREVTCP